MTFIDPHFKDMLTLVPLPAASRTVSGGAVRIITTDGGGSPGNHVIDLSLSDIERIRDVLTARLESANADAYVHS